MIAGTHHFNFTVSDVDRSVAFYRENFGCTVLFDWVSDADYLSQIVGHAGAKLRLCFLKLPGTDVRLELIQYLEPAGAARELPTNVPGAAHICFDVKDIHVAYREMRARGVRFKSPPVEITSVANKGAWGVYLTDPDGITLELRQPPGDW